MLSTFEIRVTSFASSSPPGFRAAIFFLAVFFRVTHDGLSERGTAPGFRAAIFFLAVFFRVTHDGLSERGTTRSLKFHQKRWK